MRHIVNPPAICVDALERADGSEHHPSPDTQAVMRNVTQERDPQTYAVIGAAMAVHKELGGGFLERVYHEGLALELTERGIPYRSEVEVNVHYKGRPLTCTYRADLICFPDDPVLVELKACDQLTHAHRAQLIHYMKATGIQRALLMNFGGLVLRFNARGLGTRPCSCSSLYSLRSYSSGRANGPRVGRLTPMNRGAPASPNPRRATCPSPSFSAALCGICGQTSHRHAR